MSEDVRSVYLGKKQRFLAMEEVRAVLVPESTSHRLIPHAKYGLEVLKGLSTLNYRGLSYYRSV